MRVYIIGDGGCDISQMEKRLERAGHNVPAIFSIHDFEAVVCLDGWEDSCQAIVEAAYAQLLKLPVLDPDTLEVSDRGITVEAGYTLLPEDM